MKIDITIRDFDPDFDQPSDIAALFHNHPGSPGAEAADLRVARDALTQQMIKAENEANDLRDDIADLADENQELTQRVEALVAELAESELHAARLERHNLALQSANTALRTNTLMTGVPIPTIGETVEALSLRLVDALPIGARFRDAEKDTLRVVREGVLYETIDGSPNAAPHIHGSLSSDGPFTRIEDAEDQEEN